MKRLDFISLEEAVVSFIPTGMTYYSSIISIGNTYIAVGLSLVIFICFLFILYQKNIGTYKRALAQILATGYYRNFVENLSHNLNLEAPNLLQFEEDEKPHPFTLDQIKVEIILPTSQSMLHRANEELNDLNIQRLYFKNRKDKSAFWARALKSEDGVVIKDFPRTLFSLAEYITKDFNSYYSEKVSKKYHKAFIDKFHELRNQHPDNLILSRFKITEL